MEHREPPGALLFGSISTIADTSELQREAFNEAFAQHGLDWTWDREDYRAMLASSGGKDRIASYAADRGDDVDAEAVHATKSEIFRRRLTENPPPLRDGVADTLVNAKEHGMRLALVTTTSPENVRALLDAASAEMDAVLFDLVVDSGDVSAPKPDGAAYRYALDQLDVSAQRAVAVEDNVGGVHAAADAGVRCLAFPNANTAGHDFSGADRVVDSVDFAAVAARS
ncbi:MAG TPA: HAD-IA family hydrolase [Ornithinimicrobium sp.]|uniref:HAD family hydrolase n=1 Tax=Ornithinimicrobium sp. TaxID=1977084 RepID=UPI002B459371|nr:HAD-IA family hydrolase [Ornithinimicrobium sp.]HKJ10874.1 HAD-IA family hydrolase [Ornithinimicrobium sp.]